MAQGSMKNIWSDRKREDERLQKLSAKKKPLVAADTGASQESTAEQTSEEKQKK